MRRCKTVAKARRGLFRTPKRPLQQCGSVGRLRCARLELRCLRKVVRAIAQQLRRKRNTQAPKLQMVLMLQWREPRRVAHCRQRRAKAAL